MISKPPIHELYPLSSELVQYKPKVILTRKAINNDMGGVLFFKEITFEVVMPMYHNSEYGGRPSVQDNVERSWTWKLLQAIGRLLRKRSRRQIVQKKKPGACRFFIIFHYIHIF